MVIMVGVYNGRRVVWCWLARMEEMVVGVDGGNGGGGGEWMVVMVVEVMKMTSAFLSF